MKNPLNRWTGVRLKSDGQTRQIDSSSRITLRRHSVVRNAHIEEDVDIGLLECNLASLNVGRGTYLGSARVLGVEGKLSIGRYCSVGTEITLACGPSYHRPETLSTYPFARRRPFDATLSKDTLPTLPAVRGISIGHDVWIGHNAFVLEGTTIGHGSIVAAHAVVTEDVPPYAIVAGNPGQLKKYRHPPEIIVRLLRIAWWDWPRQKIEKEIGLFKLTGDTLSHALDKLAL